MATGTTTINFGAFPGSSDASVAVTGQAGILAGSFVEAWLVPTATADHTADEHLVETIKVIAGNIVAGTGFTIYGVNTNQLNEPLTDIHNGHTTHWSGSGALPKNAQPGKVTDRGGKGTMLYGQWTVNWVWI